MSAQKTGFFYGIFYRVLVILLSLMLVLGATSTIWQFISASNNNGVPAAYGYMSVDVNHKDFYTFVRAGAEGLKANDLVLYDYAKDSNTTTLSIGKFVEFVPDGDFGNIVVQDIIHNTTETRSATVLLGKQVGKDHFSYAIVSLLNSMLMLYIFTIIPLVAIIILEFARKYVDNHDAKPSRIRKRKEQAGTRPVVKMEDNSK